MRISSSRHSEPIFNLPRIVVAAIALLVGLHAGRLLLTPEADIRFVLDFGFLPAQWSLALFPDQVGDVLRELGSKVQGLDEADRAEVGRVLLAHARLQPWTALTYAILHGSWAHVLLNALWLAAFGTPVARRLGAWRFSVLALGGALGGALAHFAANAHSLAPMVGASASISAMMGAAAYFAFTPQGGAAEEDRAGVGTLLRNRRALGFLGLWLVSNLLFGVSAAPLGITDAGIAWEAHMGGLLAGLLLFPVLDPRRNPRKGDEAT